MARPDGANSPTRRHRRGGRHGRGNKTEGAPALSRAPCEPFAAGDAAGRRLVARPARRGRLSLALTPHRPCHLPGTSAGCVPCLCPLLPVAGTTGRRLPRPALCALVAGPVRGGPVPGAGPRGTGGPHIT